MNEALAIAAAMRARGYAVAEDLTVSAPDLARFKGWSIHQLKRWRMNGRLPKSDPISRPARYSLHVVARFCETGEIF